jgi:hypothetical protein
MATGLDGEESERIIGEGMTSFCNMVPSEWLKEECGKKDTWELRILCHLELEIENCPQKNFNILACTSKC